MRILRIVALLVALVLAAGMTAQAQDEERGVFAPRENYMRNRLSDFMDIWAFGAGITAEGKMAGPAPPSLGLYLEATTFFSLGWITHHGVTAEMEGRGCGAYTESRTLWGLGPYRGWKIKQGDQFTTFYKAPHDSQAWQQRMKNMKFHGFAYANEWAEDSMLGKWFDFTEIAGDPAKLLIHRDTEFRKALFGLPRGWQAWEYVGGEVAVCDPFFTHAGVTLRAGFDLSEVFDFLLGWAYIDFKYDDLRDYED